MLNSDSSEIPWHYLYRTAAVAALISVALFLFQIVAFFVWPPPSSVASMSCKVKTTAGEKAAYLIAVLIFLLSLAIALWKLFAS
jgi:hypothetical protein